MFDSKTYRASHSGCHTCSGERRQTRSARSERRHQQPGSSHVRALSARGWCASPQPRAPAGAAQAAIAARKAWALPHEELPHLLLLLHPQARLQTLPQVAAPLMQEGQAGQEAHQLRQSCDKQWDVSQQSTARWQRRVDRGRRAAFRSAFFLKICWLAVLALLPPP